MSSLPSNPISLILIDDHYHLRHGMKILLDDEEGFTVVADTGDGDEGLRLVEEHVPDVVVLDIFLGKSSGIDLIPSIRQISEEIKIVMFSAVTGSDPIHRAVKTGCSAFVLKGDSPEELEKAVRLAHDGQSYLSPKAAARIIDRYLVCSEKKTGAELSSLTPREHELSNLIARGYDTGQIAEALFISPKTVRVHRARIMKNLRVRTAES